MNQHKPDENQEAKCQHFHRRMLLNESTDGPGKNIITPIETITAMIMMRTSFTIPTAVKIESKENIISKRMICRMVAVSVGTADFLVLPLSLLSFHLVIDLHGTFGNEEKPTEAQDQVTSAEVVVSIEAHEFYYPLRNEIGHFE